MTDVRQALIIAGCCCLINAEVLVTPGVNYDDHHHHHDDLAQPTPYQFGYSAPAEGGGITHQESGDGNGRVTGSYTIEDDDGRSRVVEYVADEGGFRAAISTNEPGTANQNPADVVIESSADNGYGGVQTIAAAPAPAPVAISPVAPVAVIPQAPVRIAPRPTPLRIRRPALVPIRPALVPIQPTIIPSEYNRYFSRPAFLPFGDSRLISPASYPVPTRIINQPAVFSVSPQLISQPDVVPIGPQLISQPAVPQLLSQPAVVPVGARLISQPAVVPVGARFISQPAVVPVGTRLISQPAVVPRLLTQPAIVPVGTRIISQPGLFPIAESYDPFRSGIFSGYRSFNDKA
ncbi:calphotin-like [Uloborus diversus]|uniref:calphotin-like n=1 Tax=Uloborus diversus TaxID=327109 RepID=UPI002409AC90|nr:calphotin-like [Uloborus diversus]